MSETTARSEKTAREVETAPAGRSIEASGAATAAWCRERMLPRLVPVGPEEIADVSAGGRRRVLRLLLRALRSERVRGRAGHWSYSLDRHVALVAAVAAERRAGRITGWGLAPQPPQVTPTRSRNTPENRAGVGTNANRRGSVDPRRS